MRLARPTRPLSRSTRTRTPLTHASIHSAMAPHPTRRGVIRSFALGPTPPPRPVRSAPPPPPPRPPYGQSTSSLRTALKNTPTATATTEEEPVDAGPAFLDMDAEVPKYLSFVTLRTSLLAEHKKLLDSEPWSYLEEKIRRSRRFGHAPDPEELRKLFIYHLLTENVAAADSDFQDLKKEDPVLKMNDALMYLVFMGHVPRYQQTCYNIWLEVAGTPERLDVHMCNLGLRIFGRLGRVDECERLLDRLLELRMLPEEDQLKCTLWASAVCSNPQAFSRYLGRLEHKGFKVSRTFLIQLFSVWGSNRKKLGVLETTSYTVTDYARVVERALDANNFQLALQLIDEMRELKLRPHQHFYGIVLNAIVAFVPPQRLAAHDWRLKLRSVHKQLPLEMGEQLYAYVKSVVKSMGGAAVDWPRTHSRPRKKRIHFTRKMTKQLALGIPEHERWESPLGEYDLFEYVPHYKERIKILVEMERESTTRKLKESQIQDVLEQRMVERARELELARWDNVAGVNHDHHALGTDRELE